jgi:uncharacterized cupredoxin-like copper-binding protein
LPGKEANLFRATQAVQDHLSEWKFMRSFLFGLIVRKDRDGRWDWAVLECQIMKFSRRLVISTVSGILSLSMFSSGAFAGTVVKVSLWDKGPTSMDMMESMVPMGMAMPGAVMDMATMGITVDSQEIPAGEVTFSVTNDSQEFYHSMVISLIEDTSKELPYLIDQMMVDEAALGSTARVKELKAHASGSVTVDMKPGTYILYCNVAGHYAMGMWTVVTVTG